MNIKGKTKRIIGLLFVTAVVLLVIVYASYTLFWQGYARGIITKDAHKINFKQMLCLHDWNDRTGICMKCALKCEHPKYDADNNCLICKYHHIHAFENFICTTCGIECAHEHWSKGICSECGYICTHPSWQDDICKQCGIYCTHPEYTEGLCALCGSPCLHTEWEDGKCTLCGIRCAHMEHDQVTGICNVCGIAVYHDFSKGVCSCGLTPPFVTDQLSPEILDESSKKGRIQTITYTTKKYNEDNEIISKNMDVYLPYDYSENNKYDVLLLIHGSGGHYYEWTNNPITVGSSMSNPRNIYDNMIHSMLCRPLIIVSVSSMYYGENGETESGYKQMAAEIRNDILPYIAEHYSTYAAGISPNAISKARNHFGIGGANDGAMYAYNCGMVENFDLFANFACFSGCPVPEKYNSVINNEDYRDLPVKCLFIGAGGNDPTRGISYSGYNYFVNSSGKIDAGVNAYYAEVSSSGYDWITWTTSIYNALLVLFPETGTE